MKWCFGLIGLPILLLNLVSCGPTVETNATAHGYVLILQDSPVLYWPRRPSARFVSANAGTNRWLAFTDADSSVSTEHKSLPTVVGLAEPHSLLGLPPTSSRSTCAGERSLLKFIDTFERMERRVHAPPSSWDLISLKSVFSAQSAICSSQQSFDCLQMIFASMPTKRPFMAASLPSHPWAEMATTLDACFRPVGLIEPSAQNQFFSIANGRVVFSPEKLLSILIYEGRYLSLAEALAAGSPVANVPIASDCRSGGTAQSALACRRSPLVVTECEGCQDLESGKIYSVFLIEQAGIPDSLVRPVIYSPPSS